MVHTYRNEGLPYRTRMRQCEGTVDYMQRVPEKIVIVACR